MPKLRIRDIPEDTFQEIEQRAALKHISVEDEIREILKAAALQFCEEEAARASQSA